MTTALTKFTAIQPMRLAGLTLAALFVLPACTLMPAAGSGSESREMKELRQAAAADPVPNWFFVPERQPAVGDRAVFETSDGPARYEIAVTARAGDRSTIRLRWTSLPASHAYLKEMTTTYVVDDRSVVRSASIADTSAQRVQPARLAEAGGPGYVSQPTVMRLPVPESAEVGGRQFRIDAVAVVESREREGMTTRILYLSDDAKLGVVRIDAFPSRVVSISDVVGQVASARMQAGQPGAKPMPLSESLVARPGAVKARVLTRLIEE